MIRERRSSLFSLVVDHLGSSLCLFLLTKLIVQPNRLFIIGLICVQCYIVRVFTIDRATVDRATFSHVSIARQSIARHSVMRRSRDSRSHNVSTSNDTLIEVLTPGSSTEILSLSPIPGKRQLYPGSEVCLSVSITVLKCSVCDMAGSKTLLTGLMSSVATLFLCLEMAAVSETRNFCSILHRWRISIRDLQHPRPQF